MRLAPLIDSIMVNGNTCRGSNAMFCLSFFSRGQFLKERICSRSKSYL